MNEYRIRQILMGSAFELVVGHDDEKKANQLLQSGIDEIVRIEKMLTEFKDDSITSSINRNAGIQAVKIPQEMYHLIARSIQISRVTQGAFDITVKPLKALYDFSKRSLQMPPKSEIKKKLNKTGFQHIKLLENNSVYLMRKGMEISFASIGKGYAADQVRELWMKHHVKSGVINASGDLTVIGGKIDGKPWQVGIANPIDPSKTHIYIPLHKGSVATSGDYEQFFEHKGIRFSHTLNPKTGFPVSGIKSVSIQAMSGELCDAIATAVSVLGVEIGLHLIDQLPDIHCIIVDDQNKIHFSKKINFEYSKQIV